MRARSFVVVLAVVASCGAGLVGCRSATVQSDPAPVGQAARPVKERLDGTVVTPAVPPAEVRAISVPAEVRTG